MMDLPIQLFALAAGISLVGILFVAAAPRAFLVLRRCLVLRVRPYVMFIYASFFKPHVGSHRTSQQAALENFYELQADGYDITRTALLKGREDLLSVLAAYLNARNVKVSEVCSTNRRIWIDIGGGTGYNIEAMSAFVSVPDFFSRVYLVDFSPSLCKVAEARFARLGWKNVKVICQDARLFRLEDYEKGDEEGGITHHLGGGMGLGSLQPPITKMKPIYAELITMSYSLSMIPDFHSVIDSLTHLLSPNGIAGVIDFYVQSDIDVRGRNYVGGITDRHVNWLSRIFWRAWFEADRVNLDSSRRDYLEYRFGTVLSTSSRNYRLGGIPFYSWVGCQKASSAAFPALSRKHSAILKSQDPSLIFEKATTADDRDDGFMACEKALELARHNLAVSLPFPSFFYQNRPWRIHYDEQLPRHTQFNDEYIYAFTWEDPMVDKSVLQIGPDDEILAITSAGDNILSYLLELPRRIHAVDLNPAQNHLLELKLAAFASLGYDDIWKLFGEGSHSGFQSLVLSRLSPHLSSRAFQYWLDRIESFSAAKGGLYATGGSRYALNLVQWLFRLSGLTSDVNRMCAASSLEDQHQIWHTRVRKIVCNRLINWAVVCQRKFLWKALGVPENQRDMIIEDFALGKGGLSLSADADVAIQRYMTDTLDPVIGSSLLARDNYFYRLCLQGRYSEACHPEYLSPNAYSTLSEKSVADRVSIHTSELAEVIAQMPPSSLTITVIMDSMDWFDKGSIAATKQVESLNRVLKMSGRVLLRSASILPWYIKDFEAGGFIVSAIAKRQPGTCIDRVNMYASCWLCTKFEDAHF